MMKYPQKLHLIIVSLLFFSTLNAAPTETAWYLPLLLDENPQVVSAGVRVVHNGYAEDELATDIIATRLYNEIHLAKQSSHSDLVAWYAKALGKSRRLKYRELLILSKKIADRTKAFRHITSALKELDIEVQSEFNPKTIAISALKEQFPNRQTNYLPPSKEAFDSLAQEMSVDALFAQIGRPFNIGLLSTTFHRYAKAGEIVCHYPGAGLVFFKPIKSLQGAYGVFTWSAEPFDVQRFYRGEKTELAQLLAMVRGRQFRQLVKENRDMIANDSSLLTLLGERIAHYLPNGIDRYEEDGMAIVVKLLAKSGDAQLQQYIKTVATNGGSGKATVVARAYQENNDITLSEDDTSAEEAMNTEGSE